MSSNRRRNLNSSRRTNTFDPGETSALPTDTTTRTDRYKWIYEQEKLLIELFDEAIAMNNYTLKNPTIIGKEYMVDKFNEAFNLNINYEFFKNKLDEFKKNYKRWKTLMKSTEISIDTSTSTIHASDAWWTERESGCKLTKKLKRKPPKFWDVMVRCFVLHDVQS
ncbi:unnamed protein product [Cochlearia groenlandica]